MTKLSAWKEACRVFVVCAATAIAAPAQTFNTLVNFAGTNGAQPYRISLVQGLNGSLYGTTVGGGANDGGQGTVFEVTPGGKLTTIYNFCTQPNCTDGDQPFAGLVLGNDGNFYGTTLGGGANNDGTAFRITPKGILTTLHSFNRTDGSVPFAALVQGTDGNFYGTTYQGGDLACNAPYGCGTVFKITPGGALTVLHSFVIAEGWYPEAALVQAIDGNFYGTVAYGGPTPYYVGAFTGGTVFRITPAGRLTLLHSFCSHLGCTDGDTPTGPLIQATDGNFYGTTLGGGTNYFCIAQGCGTAFKMTPEGAVTTLYDFCSDTRNCLDGSNPIAGLVQGTDGNFYGTTFYSGVDGKGTVFSIIPGGTPTPLGARTTLHNFNLADGADPSGGLVQATNGNFYGTTSLGGANGGGTVYSVSVGLGPFVSFLHNPAKVGQLFGVLGQRLTGTTSVSLNGIPASFKVVSDTFITATVPPGATTGFVTVATPSGTLTSNVPFRVLQ
jgi:uncharacterized repeat protein (TIGR03803 family)